MRRAGESPGHRLRRWRALGRAPLPSHLRRVTRGISERTASPDRGYRQSLYTTPQRAGPPMPSRSATPWPSRCVYSDTTVSGNSEVAEKGELVVLFGGSEDAYLRGRPNSSDRSLPSSCRPVGSASRMKLIVNHALTVQRMALAEALVVAELSGMDLDTALDVLKDSLAYSKVMDVWGDRMIAGDHEFPTPGSGRATRTPGSSSITVSSWVQPWIWRVWHAKRWPRARKRGWPTWTTRRSSRWSDAEPASVRSTDQ